MGRSSNIKLPLPIALEVSSSPDSDAVRPATPQAQVHVYVRPSHSEAVSPLFLSLLSHCPAPFATVSHTNPQPHHSCPPQSTVPSLPPSGSLMGSSGQLLQQLHMLSELRPVSLLRGGQQHRICPQKDLDRPCCERGSCFETRTVLPLTLREVWSLWLRRGVERGTGSLWLCPSTRCRC